jgi:hypothetical protein
VLNNTLEHSHFWEAIICLAGQRIPIFCRTRIVITVFTRARYWSLPWDGRIQSTNSHPIPLRSTLIYYPSKWRYIFRIPYREFICTSCLSQLCFMLCPSSFLWLDHRINSVKSTIHDAPNYEISVSFLPFLVTLKHCPMYVCNLLQSKFDD